MEKSNPILPPLRIIFAGSGEFGIPSLRAIAQAGHEIVQVVTQPDRPAGRGRSLTPTPIALFAAQSSWPLLKTASLNNETLPDADLMLVIAFGQKIRSAIADHPRLGSINLHASRLPLYRGAAPINWAILQGERSTGNSVIRLAQKMDAGAILGQSLLPIGELETAGELHDRLAADGADLVLRVIADLAAGKAIESAQEEPYATQAPKLDRNASRLDWSSSAAQIARQIRGLYPWPGCRVSLQHPDNREIAKITLVRARPLNIAPQMPPGQIDSQGHICTKDGVVEILELHPDAKRPMPLSAFSNGHPWSPSLLLKPL